MFLNKKMQCSTPCPRLRPRLAFTLFGHGQPRGRRVVHTPSPLAPRSPLAPLIPPLSTQCPSSLLYLPAPHAPLGTHGISLLLINTMQNVRSCPSAKKNHVHWNKCAHSHETTIHMMMIAYMVAYMTNA